jgi:carboxylate-amine ligase
MCDASPTLREVAAIAALAQCLVADLDARFDTGNFPRAPKEWTVRENKWLAARYGIDAELIVGAGERRPAPDLIRELVGGLRPVAKQLDCEAELADIDHILDRGPSYLRQRRVVEDGGSPEDVVRALVQELASDELTGR